MDYSLFRRRKVYPADLGGLKFDVFLSAFNNSERVLTVWRDVDAKAKAWIIHDEYGLDAATLPAASAVFSVGGAEDELQFWASVLESSFWCDLPKGSKVGIDITGLMRRYVATLPLALAIGGIEQCFLLYSDPSSYVQGSRTAFALGPVNDVRPVHGYEGVHESGFEVSDVLVIGGGYDDALIRAVAETKRAAEHVVVVGMPSLQPHMYQESLLRLHDARESIRGYSRIHHLLAPASDPFATASVLSEFVAERFSQGPVNLYLSPLGPKTQVLGFAWFYLCERSYESVSLLLPSSGGYSPQTSTGLGRTWLFELELEAADITSFR